MKMGSFGGLGSTVQIEDSKAIDAKVFRRRFLKGQEKEGWQNVQKAF